MVHFHCRLNGRPYDGCRTGGYLDLQRQNPSTGDWLVINSAAVSAPDTVASCADSHTYADSGWYGTPLTGLTPGWFTQACWAGENTRFCDPANARSELKPDTHHASTPPVRA